MTLAAAGAILPTFDPARASATLTELADHPGSPDEVAQDETYWSQIQQAFTMDRTIINLNNGGVSPAPRFVQEAMKRRLDHANAYPPPVTLWQIQHPQYEDVRSRLARQWGVDPEEIAITRNSSESLQICQFGLALRAGDEVLTTTHDYPRMITTFKQRERREGITLRQFKLPIPCEDAGAIVRLFDENITDKTRLILMSHIINITGQILPVKDVVAMARKKNGGIPVIVDGAHALAHFDFRISDLECDYYGVSLHKWLAAPHGTGLLYVRRDRIKDLWPLMAASEEMQNNIRKFEEIGTHPEANALCIGEALTFHQAIGGPRKEARLRYLRDYWAHRLLATGRAVLNTSLKPGFSCGIANVRIEGLDTARLQGWLWDKRHILTVAIIHEEFNGLRVTPSVYTTLEELDRFVEAVEHIIRHGLPSV
ncbi:MAG: aminotransferase class V-fold PLP-dependent enzyme [Phycisphaerales bacterium]|nr:aminotransferase class V-fold PLP-dependent enzyme [Phycisphaerales bacterium]